jgi:hypothetical protein
MTKFALMNWTREELRVYGTAGGLTRFQRKLGSYTPIPPEEASWMALNCEENMSPSLAQRWESLIPKSAWQRGSQGCEITPDHNLAKHDEYILNSRQTFCW